MKALPPILRPFARPSGAICALALDHRDALRSTYRRAGLPEPSEERMLAMKERVIDALGGAASALLLDVDTLSCCAPAGLSVLMPLEAQGHEVVAGGRCNRMLDAFGPEHAAALGVQGCKLLLYYRDDHAVTASTQLTLATQAAERCHSRGLALVVEPKVYRLQHESEDVYTRHFADHVTAAAAALAESGADLLKLQFPGDAASCARVASAAGSVPWTLLGGTGIDGVAFAEQLRVAVAAGACGFIAGRPIWGGVVGRPSDEQRTWLRDEARPTIERLVEIADIPDARRAR